MHHPVELLIAAVRNDLQVPLILGASPDNTRRSGQWLRHAPGDRSSRHDATSLAVALANAAARCGGNRRQPVTGVRERPPRLMTCVRRPRRKLPPRNGETQGEPTHLRPVTLAAQPSHPTLITITDVREL
jgi:hypothetical protein